MGFFRKIKLYRAVINRYFQKTLKTTEPRGRCLTASARIAGQRRNLWIQIAFFIPNIRKEDAGTRCRGGCMVGGRCAHG